MSTNNNVLDIRTVALKYHAEGFSVIACHTDKRPIGKWQDHTVERPTESEINQWFSTPISQSIGVVLGTVSNNVIVIDLDGIEAVKLFHARYTDYTENTKAILTGSQCGIHLYFTVDAVPDNKNVRVEGVGGFELRGNGQYVIAPPSPHPSGHRYSVYRDKPILHLLAHEIEDICNWFESMRVNAQVEKNEIIQQSARLTPLQAPKRKKSFLEVLVSQEIARVETASAGNRNDSLFYAGLRIANYAAGNELNWSEMASKLLSAALSNGLSEREAQRTIQSAWRIGSKNPRTVK